MNVFLQNTSLPKDPVDQEIDLDFVGFGSNIGDNDDDVDEEDTEVDNDVDDIDDDHDIHDDDE